MKFTSRLEVPHRGAGNHARSRLSSRLGRLKGGCGQDWPPYKGVAVLAIGGALLLHGQLETWIQHVPAGPVIAALFRSVAMPGGAVPILRPPAESRPALTKLIAAAPSDASLYRMRAQDDELAEDFTAAEADWKTYARTATDRYEAQIELVDFYHRRIRPREELATLTAAASAKDDPLLPETAQRGWRAFERMAALASTEDLAPAVAEPVFRAWVVRYPHERAAWQRLIEYLSAHRQYAAAEAAIASYSRAFHDDFEPVSMRADLELRRGSPQAALAVYDRAFQPLWPDELTSAYFKLLEEHGQLREFAGSARTALASNPADLDATARLFHYFKSQNNVAAARRVLLEYRIAKESGASHWTADELQTTAQLFERLPDVDEAARLYYALYSVPAADGVHAERALYGLANVLLTAPDQPIQFGSGDLSFYKDIATVDSSPGFLNGILSLVLNSSAPRREYRNENQKSAAYFHRAAGGRLTDLLEQRFPHSAYRKVLRAELISAYAAYGDDETVIRAGRAYLAAFPRGAGRVAVAMQISDALARAHRTDEEFALYAQLLRELGARSSGVPLGSGTNPRSAEYAQVLDKYLSRLAALDRPLDALRVYRGQIDRNPNDPGLYQRLAAFLEENQMAREVEEVYTKAIAKFADRSWYDKLARWYLRRKEFGDVEKISRQAIAVFSGSELESYFNEVVAQLHPDAVMYRQLNLYAHERFPEDVAFVQNLLNAYAQRETYDAAAADRLLRQYWFYEASLRSRLFEKLSADGRLYPELAAIRSANPGIVGGQFDQALAANPAAVQFSTEAEIWLSHFEAAAPAARALADAWPGKREFAEQASSLYRSLAAYDPRDTEIAVKMAGYEQRADPRDGAILARIGDIYADRDLFSQARLYWERMPAAAPGDAQAYLDTATVYWDYYLYNDALRWISAARKKFHHPALYAYQAGAIYEGKRDDVRAIREYISGALDGEIEAQNRLLRLLNRPRTHDLVNRETAAAVAADPSPEAVKLRVAVLEAQQRRADLQSLLQSRVEAEKSSVALADLQETARRLGFDLIEERACERLAAITNDPVDKMRLTLTYVRLLEAKKDIAAASRAVDTLYREHPLILGVIRGAVDFHVRNKQPDDAIAILLDAAKHARTDLAAQFTLESARVATGAGQFDRARTLLAGLLAADPLRAEYLAAMADTYIQAKNDQGFRDFELATIQRLKQSSLSPPERIARITEIRRALIPALERLKDSSGAVDQYIEIVNNYPDDAGLTQEAAAYAVSHGQTARLLAFYRKTIADAPRDYRWPIVLARIETAAEDFPAAIADYARAIQDRPDRADVFEAKGRLEERLMRFDDAIKTYGRLYELAYRDPQWMIKVAELQARCDRTADTVNALKTAFIGAHTETADADLAIAEKLEAWHMLPAAVEFAERSTKQTAADPHREIDRALAYAPIMARARRMDEVLSCLMTYASAERQISAAVGPIIAGTYTPEEKARFEQALEAKDAHLDETVRDVTLLPFAQAAGLADVEARWRREKMAAQPPQMDQRFIQLQSQRGLYADLGRDLEQYAAQQNGQPVEAAALADAAQAFIADGDIDSQLRVMGKALAHNALGGILLDRYLALLVRRRPDELPAIVRDRRQPDTIRNRAVQFAISSDQSQLAYHAVEARGRAFVPVWSKAYTALSGEYFNDRSAAIDTAFQSALDTRTIGQRLSAPLKPDTVITGSVWFYYGERFGDYLSIGHNVAADQWLPASLEAAPGNPAAYIALGDLYAERGQPAKALAEFESALELDRHRGDAYDHMARVLWSEGKRPEAMARWKSALAAFLRIQDRGVRVPELYWSWVAETFNDIGERHAFGDLRGEIAHLLENYYQVNKEYQLSELVEPAVRASLESGQGIDWLMDLAQSMNAPQILLPMENDLTDAQKIIVQRARIALEARQAAASFGDERKWRTDEVAAQRVRLISMLLDAGDVPGALSEWSQIPPLIAARARWDNYQMRDEIEIRLAAKTGGLAALLERYRTQPELAPPRESLRNAAVVLQTAGDEPSARAVLEFMYERGIRNGDLAPANFLGLAEVKLQRNDTAVAVALLNRMALVAGDEFESLLPAAQLLAKYGKTAEAADFARRRIQAAPWDAEAKMQLARSLAIGSADRRQLLAAVVTDSLAPYTLRAAAARLSAPQLVTGTAGTELGLLSSSAVTAEAAEKPYQVEARIDAAHTVNVPAVKFRLWMEALAIAPTDNRVRLGALQAALARSRDSLALALDQTTEQPLNDYNEGQPEGVPRAGRRVRRWHLPPGVAAVLPQAQMTDDERAALAESLSMAAQRVDDLRWAEAYTREAIALRPPDRRAALERRLKDLAAERDRRAKNAARQPVIRNVIEQDQIVRPRIAGGGQ